MGGVLVSEERVGLGTKQVSACTNHVIVHTLCLYIFMFIYIRPRLVAMEVLDHVHYDTMVLSSRLTVWFAFQSNHSATEESCSFSIHTQYTFKRRISHA